MSLPAAGSAPSGMDIVCHSLESYTARHYTAFAAKQPEQRVTYCGSNPVSDLWCERAMALLATSFRRAVHDGQAVSLTAPEAFRFSFASAPERHLRAAALLAPGQEKLSDPAEQLPQVLIDLMRDTGIPNGIGGVGYGESDVPELVPGTMKQQRLLATCPRDVHAEDIASILTRSIANW